MARKTTAPEVLPDDRSNDPVDAIPSDAEMKVAVDSIYEEAKNWLDGADVETEEQGEEIAKLLQITRDAFKQYDGFRKAEKAPLDEAVALVQGRYNPLLRRLTSVIDGCRSVLGTWQAKKAAELEAEQRRLREEADAAEAEAQKAFATSGVGDLDRREAAEAAADRAKIADMVARKQAKETAAVKGFGKAIGMRRRRVTEVEDYQVFARYAWREHRAQMEVFLENLASNIAAGTPIDGDLDLPGVKITIETKSA
tara:strand:+ start:4796 stop:5557 length:762 start_codon:yes stop_codon:yes gene_type:complete